MQTERIQVSAFVPRSETARLVAGWESLGLDNILVSTGRLSMLRRRHGLGAMLSGEIALTADAAHLVRVLVPAESEAAVMGCAAAALGLDHSGRGTLFSQSVTVYQAHPACLTKAATASVDSGVTFFSDLVGLVCVVQRGEGDQSARVVLESGACVPLTTFGLGTGVRDRLGLLRITIPAEKEVISAVVSSFDSGYLIEQLARAAKLDQPGRGFLYAFPIRSGAVNHRITLDEGRGQAASLDQIIASLDNLQGGIEWRSRGDSDGVGSGRDYLTGVTLELACNEGCAADMVGAAMAVGALGATICKARLPQRAVRDDGGPSPARETAILTVPSERVPVFVKAFEDAGAFDNQTCGVLTGHPVAKAITYVPRQSRQAAPAKG